MNQKIIHIMKKKNFRLLAVLFASILFAAAGCKKDDDDDNTPTPAPTNEVTLEGSITSDMTLDASKTYHIKGFVFIEDGATLTIPAGTLLEGLPGQGENASALVVKMGARLIANGTEAEPIIMTGLGDGKEGKYDKEIRGLWGGLILLGKATTNNSIAKRIEGIPEQYDAFYGMDGNAGADDGDNSGSLRYLQIRHGGTDIGAGNEINGLTLGAVGNGTTIEYIEVISNKDDGVEWFGGSVNTSHILVALCGDDAFDYDEGFHGKGQFWVAIQDNDAGDRCAEQDGGTGDDEEAAPYAQPVIFNATYYGNNQGHFMVFRDNAAGTYANSIFANASEGIELEYRDDKHSSYEWVSDANPGADLMIKNNVFSNIHDGTIATQIVAYAESGDLPPDHETVMNGLFSDNGNIIEEAGIDAGNPVPASASSGSLAAKPADPFFKDAPYHGAFQPGGMNWAASWSLYFN